MPVLSVPNHEPQPLRPVRLADRASGLHLSVRSASIDIDVDGPLAQSNFTVTFANDLDKTLEGDLIFPLPPFAAVTSLVATVGGRRIEGKVKGRSRAVTEYKRAIEAGHTAALGETEGEDLVRLRIAPIEKNEDVSVSFSVIHTLLPMGDGHKLVVPLTYMPRYVEDVTALNTTEKAALDRPRPITLAARANVVVNVKTTFNQEIAVRCASHATATESKTGALRVSIENAPLDKDIHLQVIDRSQGELPTLWVNHSTEKGPDHLGAASVVAVVPPAFADEGPTTPRQVTLLVDRSGSMGGLPMQSAIRAVKGVLRSLSKQDTFNIVAFDDSIEALARRPVQFNDENLALADRFISGIDARGGTEASTAIRAGLNDVQTDASSVLISDPPRLPLQHRLRLVVFMTDGDVAGASGVLKSAKNELRDTRLHVLGIGSSVQHSLLGELATLGGGTYTPVDAGEDLERALARLKNAMDAPLLTDVRLSINTGDATVEPAQLESSGSLDLFAGQPLLLAFRGDVPAGSQLICKGQRPDGSDARLVLPLTANTSASASGDGNTTTGTGADAAAPTASLLLPHTVWALLRNRRLTYRFDSSDNSTLEELGSAYGIVNSQTALVGVHQEQRDVSVDATAPVVLPMPQNIAQSGGFGGGGLGYSGSTLTGGLAPPMPSAYMPAPSAAPSKTYSSPAYAMPPGAPPPPPSFSASAVYSSTLDAMSDGMMDADEEAAVDFSAPAPSSRARGITMPSKKQKMDVSDKAKQSHAGPAASKGGVLRRMAEAVRSVWSGDDDADDAFSETTDANIAMGIPAAEAMEMEREEKTMAPPPAAMPVPKPAPPSPMPIAVPTSASTHQPTQKPAKPMPRLSNDEAGLRALFLEQRASGLFADDVATTLAAAAACVSLGHTARRGQFRAELRRASQVLREKVAETTGDTQILAALALALLTMPDGTAAPQELPAALAQLVGAINLDEAGIAAHVKAVLAASSTSWQQDLALHIAKSFALV